MTVTTDCRDCGAVDCEWLGPLPDGREFAGRELSTPIPGGALFRCRRCALVFRHPILEVGEYNDLYERAPPDVWATGGGRLRTDQMMVKAYIETRRPQGARVLDIGCYTGELLTSLGPAYSKFGVERCYDASQRCKEAGIAIVGEDLYACHRLNEKFDVVLAIDVIEHTSRPREFLGAMLDLLSPGGAVIITTGDADNGVWKRTKAAFWYCSYPEHISFISERWLTFNAKVNRFRIAQLVRFQYAQQATWKALTKRCLVYTLAAFGIRARLSWSAHISLDHMFAVLER